MYNTLPSAPNEVYKSIFDSLGQAKIEFPLRDTTALVLLVGKQEDREPKFYQLYFEPGVHVDLAIKNGVPEFEGDLKRVNTYYIQAANIHREMQQYSNDNIDKILKGFASEKQVFLDSLMKFGSQLKGQISNDNTISAYDQQMLHDYISLSGIVQHMNFDTRVTFHEINDKGSSVVLDSTLSNAFNDLTLDDRYRNNSLYTWFLSRRLVPLFYNIIEYREEHKVKVGEYEYVKKAVMQDAKLTNFKELLLALFVEDRTHLRSNVIQKVFP